MSKLSMLFTSIFIILLVDIYYSWFVNANIIGGDWPYFFNETLKEFTLFPPAWSLVHGNGLGGTILTYYLDQYLYFSAYLSTSILHIPWAIGYKLFWFGLFIALSISSSIYLLKTIFSRSRFWQIGLSALIFTANTYILMVVGGGQMGVALAYSIAPLVLARFIKLVNLINSSALNYKLQITNYKLQIIAGLVLSLQVMFDPRIAYLSMIAIAIYAVLSTTYYALSVKTLREKILSTLYFLLYTFAIPIGIAVLLHSYWIFPLLFTKNLPIPEGFVSVSGFEFFSFANFSNSISLLHPNWPENIFGKIYFLQPEFLILPILAYSSLLFISKIKDQRSKIQIKNQKFDNNVAMKQFNNGAIIFFALLGLVGAFLAKGASPPFSEINSWLFQNFPGMNMFRDSTKFYSLIALSYSVLIPFSIWKIYESLELHNKFSIFNFQFSIKNKIFNFQNLFLILITLYLILLIRPVFLGQLGGTFEKHEVPSEYIKLKDFLYDQPDFFRTLWIPRQQRFTFASNIHPAVEVQPLFKATDSASSLQANSAQTVSKLQRPESKRLLEELSVKYVIIPYDSIGEIFMRDRKYDEKQRVNLEKQLDNIGWLKKIKTGKITVYETQSYKNHFWLQGEGKVIYEILSPTAYDLDIEISQPTKLVFSENFSPYWIARIDGKYVTSNKTKNGLNSFVLNKVGKYNVKVYYTQEKYFYYGRLVSLFTVIVLVVLLIGIRRNFIFKN
ncbi:MAG: hypothetical protein AAB609_00650 [Patescibacteria group bacterium]